MCPSENERGEEERREERIRPWRDVPDTDLRTRKRCVIYCYILYMYLARADARTSLGCDQSAVDQSEYIFAALLEYHYSYSIKCMQRQIKFNLSYLYKYSIP